VIAGWLEIPRQAFFAPSCEMQAHSLETTTITSSPIIQSVLGVVVWQQHIAAIRW
jgi:hypothetical protein